MGSRSRAFKMDVTDLDEVGRVVQTIEAELGTIDILINNAAVMDNLGKFGEQQPERWQRDLNSGWPHGSFIAAVLRCYQSRADWF